MKVTALNQKHKDLGAKMVPFAGYEMPVQYAGAPGASAVHVRHRAATGVGCRHSYCAS